MKIISNGTTLGTQVLSNDGEDITRDLEVDAISILADSKTGTVKATIFSTMPTIEVNAGSVEVVLSTKVLTSLSKAQLRSMINTINNILFEKERSGAH